MRKLQRRNARKQLHSDRNSFSKVLGGNLWASALLHHPIREREADLDFRKLFCSQLSNDAFLCVSQQTTQ
jgi:hypothetical protein